MNDNLKQKLQSLPEMPGSYQMLDAFGNIIYVGKAKNLKNRVRSYFVGSHDQKTQALVSNVVDFTYIVTKTETEAFLLELSLIKEHSPRYNIMLMDDKSYPYIEITNETHPKLQITRRPRKNMKNLFGPYPDASSARETMELLNRIFPLRKCQQMPKKVCLYYHIGQCLGPCEFPVSQTEYAEIIRKIRSFLSGNNSEVRSEVLAKMEQFSTNLEFEKALEMKQILDSIDKTAKKQQIIFKDMLDRDVFSFDTYDQYMVITILFMRNGKITFSENKIFTITDDVYENFLSYVAMFYQKNPIPNEVVLPDGFDTSVLEEMLLNRIIVPKRGAKKNLLDIAHENAHIHLQNNLDSYLKKNAKTIQSVRALEEAISLQGIHRIEAFDNSNTYGSHPVSAMVVFTDGLPDRKQYRKYIVKSVVGADDYHTMQEVMYRRYQRMLMDNSIRPDLIVMDGGIQQVHAAKEILSSLYLDIPVVGLKKNEFHKTSALVGLDEQEIELDTHSPLFFFLSKIQEEVHRFAITFHRSRQSSASFSSVLDAIPGIGRATKQKMLLKFKTIEAIKSASDEEMKSCGLTKPMVVNLKIALQMKVDEINE